MIIAACPECRDKVTVPTGLDRHAFVRCPLCREEFELASVLERMPPTLELVRLPDGVEALADESDEQAFAGQLFGQAAIGSADDVELETAGLETIDDAAKSESAFDFDSGPSSGTATPDFKATPRPKKKQKSPVAEIAKIAGGGIVGVVLAILIMWWGLGRDPFDFGPKVGGVVPWLVPVKFRPPATSTADDSVSANGEMSSAATGNGLGRSAPPNDRGNGDPATGLDTSASEGLADSDRLGNGLAMDEPPFGPSSDADLAPSDPFGPLVDLEDPLAATAPEIPIPSLDPTLDLTTIEEPATASPATTTDDPDVQIIGVRGVPPVSAQQLDKVLLEVTKATDAWDQFEGDSKEMKRELGMRFYASLAQLGHSATFVDPQDPETPKRVDAMVRQLNELAQETDKMQLVRAVSKLWLQPSQRTNDGVALLGTVSGIEQQGPLFEIKLEFNSGEGSGLKVLTFTDPTDIFFSGDKLLVLGALVDDPGANLAGYEGDAAQVMVVGMPVKLPSE